MLQFAPVAAQIFPTHDRSYLPIYLNIYYKIHLINWGWMLSVFFLGLGLGLA